MTEVVSRFTDREREWLLAMPAWVDDARFGHGLINGETLLVKIDDLERLVFAQAAEIDAR